MEVILAVWTILLIVFLGLYFVFIIVGIAIILLFLGMFSIADYFYKRRERNERSKKS